MSGASSSIYRVKINNVDYSTYVTNILVSHAVQTLTPTFSVAFGKNLPITGGETFNIEMGYGSTFVPMLTNGTVSTFSRTMSRNGVEFIVNGRGPLARILDDGPILDQIYVPTWNKSYSNGDWVSTACGIKRTDPVPPGVDPNQDPAEYTIYQGEWYVHTILKDIATKLNLTFVLTIPDAKYRETFRINRTQTWISAIQQLVSVWEPIIFMRDNKLYILDVDMALPESSNMTYGPDSCVVVNINNTKNNITNRIIIRGGVDESVPPDKHKTYVPPTDSITQFMGEDLSSDCTELWSEHRLPSSSSYFSGTRVVQGYYQPMFGDPVHVYTKTVEYYRDTIIKVKVEMNYFNTSGVWGPDQQVCVKVFRKRIQEFVVAGFYTEAVVPVFTPIDVTITKGFSGSGNTGGDAADPQGQAILPVSFGQYTDYLKLYDVEELHDAEVGTTSSAIMSRTFGIMPKVAGMSTMSPGMQDPSKYYLVGGAPVMAAKDLHVHQNQRGAELSYRIINERVVLTDVKTSSMALKQTSVFDYTKMTSDFSPPFVETNTEVVLINQSGSYIGNKKPLYQYHEYFEDMASINKYGYKAVVTYYDPSIINTWQATVLKNKIFAKSGRVEQEIVIQPTIGNPMISVGKSLILDPATYKQVNFELYASTKTQVYEDVTVEGGTYIINGIRHSFDRTNGFRTEIALRKLSKLIT